jgi:simple sugar transport system substrate-binding protein
MAAGGVPPGFNITVGSLYDKSTVDTYDKMMSGK